MNESYTPIYLEQTTHKCVDSLIRSITTIKFGALAIHNRYFLYKGALLPLPIFTALPGAKGYYFNGQHNILGNFATKLLSCITVWNVL